MTNLNIHKFSVDQASGNVESVTFVRDDGSLQTFNNENQTISASFTENGTYIPPTGYTGFDSVEINVPPSGKLETVTLELDTDAQTIRPNVGYDGIGEVRVPKSNLESLSVQLTPNQTTYVAAENNRFGYSQVTVPGYSSLLANVSLQDLEDANIGLGFSKTITVQDVYGSDTDYKGIGAITLPPAILQTRTVTPSISEQVVRPSDGAYGISEVTIESVNSVLESGTFTQNGTYYPTGNSAGFSDVTVDVDLNLEELNISRNGTYYPSEGKSGFSKVVANVQAALQEKTVTYTTNNTSNTVIPDPSYEALSRVNVNVAVPIEAEVTDTITSNDTYYYYPSQGYDGIAELALRVAVPTLVPGAVTLTFSGSYPEGFLCEMAAYRGMDFSIQTLYTATSPYQIYANVTTNVSNAASIRLCGTLYMLQKQSGTLVDTIDCSGFDVTATYGTSIILRSLSQYVSEIVSCFVAFQYVEVTDTSDRTYAAFLSGNATMVSQE